MAREAMTARANYVLVLYDIQHHLMLCGGLPSTRMIPIEVFAAKDPSGALQGIMITVPVGCGLKQADTLRIHGTQLLPLERRSILPIDLPKVDEESLKDLLEMAKQGRPLAIGEFTAVGLADCYLVTLEVAGAQASEVGL